MPSRTAPAVAALALTALPLLCSADNTPRYRAVILPILPDGHLTEASDLNNLGVATGRSGSNWIEIGTHLFTWSQAEGMTWPDDSDWDITEGIVLNDAGQVGGQGCIFPGQSCHGTMLRYTPGIGIENIGTLGGDYGQVRDINEFGDVVGYWSDNGFSRPRAFYFSDHTGLLNLGALDGVGSSYAEAVNDAGDVVGYSWKSNVYRAFLWRNGVMEDLGHLGGGFSSAADINNSAEVTGQSWSATMEPRAFYWSQATGMIDIHPDSPGRSEGLFINDHGQVAGTYFDGTRNHVFLWDADAGFRTFQIPGLEDSQFSTMVSALNDNGQIIATGHTELYESIPVLWSPESGLVELAPIILDALGWTSVFAVDLNDAGQILVSRFQESALLTPVPYTLEVGDLVAGQPAGITVSNATPETLQYVAVSLRGPGHTPVPPLGVTLELADPRLLISGPADGSGNFAASIPVPAGSVGRTVWLQAAETGLTSEVVEQTIR